MRLALDRYTYMNMDWVDLQELNRLGDEGWHPATPLLGIRDHGVDRWRGLMVRRRTEEEVKVHHAAAEGWRDHQARRGDLCPPEGTIDPKPQHDTDVGSIQPYHRAANCRHSTYGAHCHRCYTDSREVPQDDMVDSSIRAMAHQVKQRDW